ncbi:MAG TPA: hypothetical protein VL501_03425, partial [Pyrinomonadaceae bacterium]|nr:hypothetical protein [Pyrinomonadaceae bacterium]
MKLIISASFIAVLAVFGFGQGSRVTGSSSGNASAKADRNSGQISLAEGTRIDGELQKTLDVKNLRPGDQVLLKTTRDIKQNGRTVIQKGSTLVGHVTDVAQRSKQNSQSRLGMLFDRVQGHGLDMPISASIVSITQAAANAHVADMADADVFGSSSTSGGVSSGRSSGGSSGGLLGGVGNTVGGLTNGVTNTAGSVVGTSRQTVGGVTNGLGSTVNGVASGANGITILNSGSTNASAGNGSILASSSRNVRLEKGSTI